MAIKLQKGTLLVFNKKVGSICPLKGGEWVILREQFPKGRPSFFTLGIKGSYIGIGGIDRDVLEKAIDNDVVDVVGHIHLDSNKDDE